MSLEQTNVLNPAQNGAGSGINDLPVSGQISVEEQAEVKSIMAKFRQWKRVRDMYSKPWLEYYKIYRGAQWSDKRKPWKNSEVVNLIWQTIQSSAPLQTDARPKFIFLPSEPSDLEFANLIERISDQDWDKWAWMQTVLEVILDGYIYGTGVSSMKYDQSLLYGIGAPVYKSEEPFYIFPDPDCNDFNDDESEGMFHAYPMTTSKLKARFPHKAHLIKADCKDWLKAKKADVKSSSFYSFYKSSTHNLPDETFEVERNNNDVPKTLVIEAYLKPNDLEEITETEIDEASGQQKNIYKVKKKYPNGRHVVIANGMILLDEPKMPCDDGLIPYSKYINYCDGREFWGISEIEQLDSPQRVLNKILSYAIDMMLYCSNPAWIVSNDADVQTDNITNEPGLIIEKSPTGSVERISGEQIPPHFMQVLDRLVSWFNDIAGQSDFSRGEAPGGVTAASAIEQLITASRTRIRQKQRNLDVYLKSVGRQYLNRVLNYYTLPRIYRMTKEDGTPYWLKFSIEKSVNDAGDQETSALLQSYDLVGKSIVVSGEPKRIFLRGELDIKVQAGSDLPFEEADKERKALALFDRQIIDAEEVLDQIRYPNKEKVLARLAEREQEAAQMAQMQQQQQIPQ